MFANEHTIICSYSVRTGAMNRSPKPTECALLLFMRNQCLFHVYTIFVPTSCCGLATYNQCLFANTHWDMWLHLYNSVWTGTINRTPTPTECTLLLFMYNQCLFHEYTIFVLVHQRLPTCTHCREPIYRARISRNTRYGLSTHTYIILVHLARISRNTRCGHSLFHLFCFSFVP